MPVDEPVAGGQPPEPLDVSAAEAAELRRLSVLSSFLQGIVEAARDGVLAVSPDRRVLAVNRQFCELWRLPPGSVQPGQPSPALGPAQLGQVVHPDAFEAAIRWGHEHPRQTQVVDVLLKDGRVIEGYAAPILDERDRYLGRVWYLHDETERRAAEKQQSDLLDQLAAAQTRQRFLLDASEVLARATGFAQTLASLAEVAVPTLGDLCLIDVSDERGNVTRMAAAHADPARRQLVAQLRGYPPDPQGEHPSVQVMRDGVSRWSNHMSEAFLQATTRDPGHLELLKELELSSYMAVPLVAGNQILGAVTLVSTGARRYSPDDLALAEDLARRVALVVAKERRFDRERSSSHALQTSLLPHRLPAVAGVEVAVRYLPGTKDAEVGGDFWDVVALPTGEVALMVGDVAGHDMTAAATMAQIRAACRAWRAHTTGPADLISVIQDGWHQLDLDRIATAVFARLHPGSGRLRIASAGHPLPLIIAESTASFVEVQCAPPFGAPARRPDTWEAILPAGGMVLFFTDGLVEDRHRQIDEGLRQLMKAATSSPLLEPEALADHVLATVSGDERSDDIALVIVRRKPAGRSPDQPVGQRMPAGGMPDLPFRLC